jgi:hypothetical protein
MAGSFGMVDGDSLLKPVRCCSTWPRVVLVQVISGPGRSMLRSTAAQEPRREWPEQVGGRLGAYRSAARPGVT